MSVLAGALSVFKAALSGCDAAVALSFIALTVFRRSVVTMTHRIHPLQRRTVAERRRAPPIRRCTRPMRPRNVRERGRIDRFSPALTGCRPCRGSMRCCRRSMGWPPKTIGSHRRTLRSYLVEIVERDASLRAWTPRARRSAWVLRRSPEAMSWLSTDVPSGERTSTWPAGQMTTASGVVRWRAPSSRWRRRSRRRGSRTDRCGALPGWS